MPASRDEIWSTWACGTVPRVAAGPLVWASVTSFWNVGPGT